GGEAGRRHQREHLWCDWRPEARGGREFRFDEREAGRPHVRAAVPPGPDESGRPGVETDLAPRGERRLRGAQGWLTQPGRRHIVLTEIAREEASWPRSPKSMRSGRSARITSMVRSSNRMAGK